MKYGYTVIKGTLDELQQRVESGEIKLPTACSPRWHPEGVECIISGVSENLVDEYELPFYTAAECKQYIDVNWPKINEELEG